MNQSTMKPVSIVSERTVGKGTVNAGTEQLQERMKCERNTRKQKMKMLHIALWPTRINILSAQCVMTDSEILNAQYVMIDTDILSAQYVMTDSDILTAQQNVVYVKGIVLLHLGGGHKVLYILEVMCLAYKWHSFSTSNVYSN